jgi:hypothetical protein
MPKLKTYQVLMSETHAKYYEVKAIDEDQATQRAYDYDEDKSWALGTWDEGVVDSVEAETNEVEE